MQNEIPLPYYLQQHEIKEKKLTNFYQRPNAAKSLQMTMNPYLMGGFLISSNKPLILITGTDPEYLGTNKTQKIKYNHLKNHFSWKVQK